MYHTLKNILFSLLLFFPALASAEVMLDVDMRNVNRFQAIDSKKPDMISGDIMPPLQEDSQWANIRIKYTRGEEDGQYYLRAEISERKSGQQQYKFKIGNIKEKTLFRLYLAARSETGNTLIIQFRDNGGGYKTRWKKEIGLGGGVGLKSYNYTFVTDPLPKSISLIISGGMSGNFDLGAVRLERISMDEYVAELNKKYPGGGPHNYCRTSRFPLGLPSGWSLARGLHNGDDIRVFPDEKQKDANGVPALRVEVPENYNVGDKYWKAKFYLYSSPVYLPFSHEPHVFSFHVKGEMSAGGIIIYADGDKIARLPFSGVNSPDKWTRVDIAFQPKRLAQYHVIQILNVGNYWLDGMQVSRGEKPKPYAMPDGGEVHFKDPHPSRVLFTDQPFKIEYLLILPEKHEGAQAVFTAHNLYGESQDVARVKIGKDRVMRGTLTVKDFAKHPLGGVRIEGIITDKRGKAVSSGNEIVIYRMRRPHYWGQQAPHSPFGVHCTLTERQLYAAKAMGINWVRLHDVAPDVYSWRYVEATPGNWKFNDKKVDRILGYHLEILAAYGQTPPWARWIPPDTGGNNYYLDWYQPKDLAAQERYVQMLTRHYKGKINNYEIWNEPYKMYWFKYYDKTKKGDERYVKSETPEEDFAEMSKRIYRAAKKADPNVHVIGVCSRYQDEIGRNWMANAVRLGTYDAADSISFHGYLREAYQKLGTPDSFLYEATRQNVFEPIKKVKGNLPKKMWMTEGGAAVSMVDNGLYNYTVVGNKSPLGAPMVKAEKYIRYMIGWLAMGIERWFLYSMHGAKHFNPNARDWSALVTQDLQLHPSAAVHSQLAWRLEDTEFVKSHKIKENVYVHLFKGVRKQKGRAVGVVMAAQTTYELPRGGTYEDMFGNPLEELTVSGYSVYVIGKSAEEIVALLK
jgi:hypothetical protein